MADVVGGGTDNVTLYDESGNQLGTLANPLRTSGPASASVVPVTSVSVSATGATNGAQLDCTGMGVVSVTLTGTWTGSIAFESSIDGQNWFPVNGVSAVTGLFYGSNGVAAQSVYATANGLYRINSAGYKYVRAWAVTLTAGPVVIGLFAESLSDIVTLAEPAQITSPDTVVTGSLANVGDTVTLSTTGGDSSFSIDLYGTAVWGMAALVVERQANLNGPWTAIGVFQAGTQRSYTYVMQGTAYHGNASSSYGIRVRVAAAATTAGTTTLTIRSSSGTGTITIGAIAAGIGIGKPLERLVRAGFGYFASSGQQTLAVAGNLRMTITNPSTANGGNGRNLYLYRLSAFATVSGYGHLFINPTTGLPVGSKRINNANTLTSQASTATVNVDTSTTTGLGGGVDSGVDLPISQSQVVNYELDPFIIAPGVTVGINVAYTGATTAVATIYWGEETA